MASGSRPAPETPFGTRGLTLRHAGVTQHSLAAGSRAATRSSAPPKTRCASTSASSSSREANTLVEEPPTWRWSLVGGADERVAARDPAASVTRLFTAQCALDCSLFEWCFGRRARARRDDRLDRSTAPHRTAPHRRFRGGGKNCNIVETASRA